MKTENKFQDGLKQLISDRPLEEINVIMLCEKVDSNRQTFYYHYRDISDVVDSIFLKEKIGHGKKLMDYEPILKEMVNYINSNFKFIESINKSYASDKFESFLFSYFYTKIGFLLKDRKYSGIDICRYISCLSSKELALWVSSKRKEKAIILQKRLTTIWHYLVNQYQSDLSRS